MFNPGRNTKHQIPSSREVPESKHQKPSSKHQRNPKSQAPNRGPRFELGTWSLELLWCLVFGVWSSGLGASLELGAWNLELFAWALSFSKIEMCLSHLKDLFELRQVPWAVAGDVGDVFQTDPTQFRIIKPRLDRHDVADAQRVV